MGKAVFAMTSQSQSAAFPLSERDLETHVEQRIAERMALTHLYRIEQGENGPCAVPRGQAAASIWRVVQDAVREAGGRIVR